MDCAEGAEGAVTGTSLVKVSNALTDTFQIKLNGHDRFAARDYKYFSQVQVYGNITVALEVWTPVWQQPLGHQMMQFVFIHSPLNQKNINHPEHVTSRELITHNLSVQRLYLPML